MSRPGAERAGDRVSASDDPFILLEQVWIERKAQSYFCDAEHRTVNLFF